MVSKKKKIFFNFHRRRYPLDRGIERIFKVYISKKIVVADTLFHTVRIINYFVRFIFEKERARPLGTGKILHQAHPDSLVEIRRLPGFKKISSWEYGYVNITYFGGTGVAGSGQEGKGGGAFPFLNNSIFFGI